MQHRDGLGERDGHVGVGGGLARGLRGFAFQLDKPFGGGVRLGGRQPGQVIGERGVATTGPTKPVTGARVDLPVNRVVRLALHDLPGGEAEGLCSRSPPSAGRFPGLGGVDVVAARRAASGLALGLPDVAQVVTLRHGDDHGQTAASSHQDTRAAGLTMII